MNGIPVCQLLQSRNIVVKLKEKWICLINSQLSFSLSLFGSSNALWWPVDGGGGGWGRESHLQPLQSLSYSSQENMESQVKWRWAASRPADQHIRQNLMYNMAGWREEWEESSHWQELSSRPRASLCCYKVCYGDHRKGQGRGCKKIKKEKSCK